MLTCTSLTGLCLIVRISALTEERTRAVQQTTKWISNAYEKGKRIARHLVLCCKTELYPSMQGRKKEKTVKSALDLQNTTQLCLLLKEKVFHASMPSTFREVNMEDVDVYTMVESDLKSRQIRCKAGIDQHGLDADGDGATLSIGRQRCHCYISLITFLLVHSD